MTGINRRISKQIKVGDVVIGGGAPVVVQSMVTTHTRDIDATVKQVKELEAVHCKIVRVAVDGDNDTDARAITEIKKQVSIPVIADIHFHTSQAIAALEAGCDGLRINPGNMSHDKPGLKRIIQMAKERSVPIRIGLNAGSLKLDKEKKANVADAMVEEAKKHYGMMEDLGFDLIKISLKAFDVPTTIEAYKKIAEACTYPLHIGITEAGPMRSGIVRSSVGIGTLLYSGLGDTLRVSLTAHPVEEVKTAYELLKSLNMKEGMNSFIKPTLISCPCCGRTKTDVATLMESVKTVDEELMKLTGDIKVAVMGCEVNGPGEAKDADIGIAFGADKFIMFKNGKKLQEFSQENYVGTLMDEVNKMLKERSK